MTWLNITVDRRYKLQKNILPTFSDENAGNIMLGLVSSKYYKFKSFRFGEHKTLLENYTTQCKS